MNWWFRDDSPAWESNPQAPGGCHMCGKPTMWVTHEKEARFFRSGRRWYCIECGGEWVVGPFLDP